MNREDVFRSYQMAAFAVILASGLGSPARLLAQSPGDSDATRAATTTIGPGNAIVHSKFGGSIFGFDIDQNGTEGVLSEGQTLPNGKTLAAVETFDQATGKFLKVVKKSENLDDFVTHGIVGTSIGLIEHQIVTGIYISKRVYEEMNPLDANKFTGTWKAPLTKDDIIIGVSRDQGS